MYIRADRPSCSDKSDAKIATTVPHVTDCLPCLPPRSSCPFVHRRTKVRQTSLLFNVATFFVLDGLASVRARLHFLATASSSLLTRSVCVAVLSLSHHCSVSRLLIELGLYVGGSSSSVPRRLVLLRPPVILNVTTTTTTYTIMPPWIAQTRGWTPGPSHRGRHDSSSRLEGTSRAHQPPVPRRRFCRCQSGTNT